MMGWPGRGWHALGVLPLGALLAGCGVLTAEPGATPARPTTGERLVARATVLDDGTGPELCVGAVAESYPPQCGGPPIRDWVWPEQGVERSSGVIWGAFVVVGTYDGHRFTFDKIITADQAAASFPVEQPMDFASPCPEPPGGWRAKDPSRSTAEDQERVLALAERLPGYGGSWIDDRGDPSQDPLTTVVNVRVTGDLDQAERRLRTVWGGPLCVSPATHSDRQLRDVLDEVTRSRSDVLTATYTPGLVELDVIFDDGTLQRQLDGRYGPGWVKVSSALRPYVG